VLTPKATFEALVAKGEANAKMSNAKTLFASIMGGCYVGMGGLLSISIAGSMPGVAAANPGEPTALEFKLADHATQIQTG
jgi:formate/nitrite transporter FocA (FNT family)